jgi:peptide deformylase
MPVREILQLGDPRLHERCADVSAPIPDTLRDLADTLADFRQRTGFGRGIAAPQIGVLQRAIFIRMPAGFAGALVNPRIEWMAPERFELWDDCFSFPDLLVRVSRAVAVRVAFTDPHGAAQILDARDQALAELLQHELDHLDGILATQKAISPTAFATRSYLRGPESKTT